MDILDLSMNSPRLSRTTRARGFSLSAPKLSVFRDSDVRCLQMGE